jgi:hypothetical protein
MAVTYISLHNAISKQRRFDSERATTTSFISKGTCFALRLAAISCTFWMLADHIWMESYCSRKTTGLSLEQVSIAKLGKWWALRHTYTTTRYSAFAIDIVRLSKLKIDCTLLTTCRLASCVLFGTLTTNSLAFDCYLLGSVNSMNNITPNIETASSPSSIRNLARPNSNSNRLPFVLRPENARFGDILPSSVTGSLQNKSNRGYRTWHIHSNRQCLWQSTAF